MPQHQLQAWFALYLGIFGVEGNKNLPLQEKSLPIPAHGGRDNHRTLGAELPGGLLQPGKGCSQARGAQLKKENELHPSEMPPKARAGMDKAEARDLPRMLQAGMELQPNTCSSPAPSPLLWESWKAAKPHSQGAPQIHGSCINFVSTLRQRVY